MTGNALTRRGFVTTAAPAAGAAALVFGPAMAVAAAHMRGSADSQESPAPSASSDDARPSVYESFPKQDPARVREVVGASHGRFDAVRALVEASPALCNATWDWGFGDWETALGAASHTGRREIALYLIDKGARPDIFTCAMLGDLDAVKSMIDATPGVQRNPGPHGITLLSHAKAGRDAASHVVAYLESLGDADKGQTTQPLTAAERAVYVGRYEYGDGADEWFEIDEKNEQMVLQPSNDFYRFLFCVEPDAFHPAGARAVRIRFEVKGDVAIAATVHDPDPIAVARRVDA